MSITDIYSGMWKSLKIINDEEEGTESVPFFMPEKFSKSACNRYLPMIYYS